MLYLPKNTLQRVTQTHDPFCIPAQTIHKKASPLSLLRKSPMVARPCTPPPLTRARLRTAEVARSPPRRRKRRCRPRRWRRRRPRQRCWSGTRHSSRGWRSCAEYFAVRLGSPAAGRQVLRRRGLPRPRLRLLRRGGMRTGEEAHGTAARRRPGPGGRPPLQDTVRCRHRRGRQLGGVLGRAVVLRFGMGLCFCVAVGEG